MFDIYILINLAVIVGLLGLAMTVLISNSRAALNRIFALFVLCVTIWIPANYISNQTSITPRDAVIANYFVFFFSYYAAVFLLQFSINMAEDVKAQKIFKRLSPFFFIVGLTCFTPLVVKSAQVQGTVYALTFGPLSNVYFGVLILTIAASFFVLHRNIKKAKEGNQRGRLKVLLVSLYFTMPLLLLTNSILPAATGWFGLTNIGILSMLVLVGGLYYGVVKHKLFDLRLIIVRSLAYVLSIGTIGLVYGFVAFGLVGRLFFKEQQFNLNQQLVYTLLAIVLVFTFPPIQKFFNRITNSLFYRDAYDQQVLLNQLGTLFALEIDIKKITRRSLDIICTEMKIQSGRLITITDNNSTHITTFGDVSETVKNDQLFKNIKQKVVSLDDLEIPVQHREELRALDISIIVRLVTKEGLVGYLLLGPKKSGNIYNKQDIDVLTIISNEMAVAVQNSLLFERITQFNITLQARVDEATRRLRRTNEKLKALDETKDDFISMASHQLRTPLTSIKGYISMVLEEDAGKLNKQQSQMLGQAFISSQRMVYLIADLLNVSRLKTGKFVIERTQINLAQIVPQELEQLKETAASRNLTMQLDVPKDFPDTMLDETKIRQVIMNFADNAIYYTPSGGHIKIRLINNPNTIEFRVEDDGIGVAKSEQHHLFSKFYRAGNARKARPDGTGLGLFMAKKVVVAQNGSIIFETQEGKGSTFGFTFSKSSLAVPKDGSPAALPVLGKPPEELQRTSKTKKTVKK